MRAISKRKGEACRSRKLFPAYWKRMKHNKYEVLMYRCAMYEGKVTKLTYNLNIAVRVLEGEAVLRQFGIEPLLVLEVNRPIVLR